MVAFLYSPGCEINTRHQPNADTVLHSGGYFCLSTSRCGGGCIECLRMLLHTKRAMHTFDFILKNRWKTCFQCACLICCSSCMLCEGFPYTTREFPYLTPKRFCLTCKRSKIIILRGASGTIHFKSMVCLLHVKKKNHLTKSLTTTFIHLADAFIWPALSLSLSLTKSMQFVLHNTLSLCHNISTI